jgi:Family of unknown function (DUF5682)
MTTTVFGIRHHGAGSARSLLKALEELKPDIILVEGAPDADKVLPFIAHADMKPPVAILVYVPDQPSQAAYYPFAVFSPEWQALRYAFANNIPARFMDLPVAHRFAHDLAKETAPSPIPNTQQPTPLPDAPLDSDQESEATHPSPDPLGWLAQAAGYSDGERWWEHMVEHRRDGTDLFAAILEAMTVLREEYPDIRDELEPPREASMRQIIRKAQKEGYQNIAVVCGAWHAPVLAQMPATAKEDADLLKDLPTVKVETTWVPWTHGRLSYMSGYGAGIESPGWYRHLWEEQNNIAIRWMSKVAHLLRGEGLDASSAHIIESVRLAEALAAVRDHPLPGLSELNEATISVLLNGETMPMKLIGEKLIVGEILGEVPDETPTVPLQRDLIREQKRLRLKPEVRTELKLDLRNEPDRAKSSLLHRLNLLGIAWGRAERTGGKGTFKENWTLHWQPELAVRLIEAGIWGNTVLEAATALTRDAGNKAADLPTLTNLINRVVVAELPQALDFLMGKLQAQAALSSDVTHLMGALPPLADVLRYGDVRQTDTALVGNVVDGLVTRICIGLPNACASLNDDASAEMLKLIDGVNGAMALLQNSDYRTAWLAVLAKMSNQDSVHGLIKGRLCRILLDAGTFSDADVVKHMRLALSPANEPAQSAAWVEGFLQGSGLLLIHDDKLLQLLNGWISELNPDTFTALLPLLRRTFSTFSAPERRQIGEKVKKAEVGRQGSGVRRTETSVDKRADFDEAQAALVLPLVAQLLGVVEEQV